MAQVQDSGDKVEKITLNKLEKTILPLEIEEQLPPLQDLIDAAIRYSPEIKFHLHNMKEWEYSKQESLYNWLKGIYLGTEWKMGKYTNSPLDEMSTGYSFGPFIKISLFDIVSVFTQRNQKQEKINQYRSQQEVIKVAVARTVTNSYYNTLVN